MSVYNADINKILVSNKVAFDKKGFKYFIGYKDGKKLKRYPQFFQKWVHIEEILMKLNISSLTKNDELLEKYNEIWDKVSNTIKSNLGGLFRGPVWGGGGAITLPSCLKLVRIMLETWNLVRKYTNICSFRKYTF